MTKAEFLNTLRTQLMGEISTPELDSTIRYYEEYISDAIQGNKTEAEVLEELGSPLLIARTIIETAGQNVDGPQRVYKNSADAEGKAENENYSYRQFNLNSITAKIILAAVITIILVLVFTILKILIPLIIPVLIIWLILTIIRRGGHS